MLDLEQLLSDLRGLENELDGMGVEAVLDERDDGMPEFHFGEFGGGLSWWVNKGFYLTIWAGDLSDVYDTDIFCEFRHELMRRLADQYEGKAQDTRDAWGRLCGDDTPMPANLAEKADGYERMAERLRDAIKDDGVPVFIDNFADFKLLRQHDPRDLLADVAGQRLRDMGLVERKYCPGDMFDELTDKGRAAVEYTARTMGVSLTTANGRKEP